MLTSHRVRESQKEVVMRQEATNAITGLLLSQKVVLLL